MKYDDSIDIEIAREQKVVKSNEIIQKARFSLSVVEQKTIAYLVSKIKPEDKELKEYEFEIIDFCKMCGIDYKNGKNYKDIKNTLQGLISKVFWVELPDGYETSVNWVQKAWIRKGSGSIKIRLDDDLQKYLIGLTEQFTQYELLYTLPMQSQYSFRIYELLKSHSWKKKSFYDFSIDDLKNRLMATNYIRFPDFRRYVLDISMREINEFTDLEVSWEPLKKGKKVITVRFYVKIKDDWEKIFAKSRATESLCGIGKSEIKGQRNIFDE